MHLLLLLTLLTLLTLLGQSRQSHPATLSLQALFVAAWPAAQHHSMLQEERVENLPEMLAAHKAKLEKANTRLQRLSQLHPVWTRFEALRCRSCCWVHGRCADLW